MAPPEYPGNYGLLKSRFCSFWLKLEFSKGKFAPTVPFTVLKFSCREAISGKKSGVSILEKTITVFEGKTGSLWGFQGVGWE